MRTQTIATLLAALCVSATASAEIRQNDRQVLETFYHATNGDAWLRNAGWLEPGTSPCDWYGVVCEDRFELDYRIVRRLELPDNNLTGTLDERIFEIVHERLDLSGNEIGGALPALPASPGEVDLSNNALTEQLPSAMSRQAGELSGTARPSSNWYLDLSGNDFTGPVPETLTQPKWLSLADNRLEGLPVAVLNAPGHPLGGKFLDLSGNHFSGNIPASVMEVSYLPHNGASRWGGGLNLCWNDFEVNNSVVSEWLQHVHVGGEFERCLSTERTAIDTDISGSWYDPERGGEGITIQQLDNGSSLIYFFTFDEKGQQQWLFDVQETGASSVDWNGMLRTRGRFGEGLVDDEGPAAEVRGSFRIDRTGQDTLIAERVYIDETSAICLSIYPPPLSCYGSSLSDRREYQRLSQLAGTTCENQSDFQRYSGAWYNPQRSGEGFIIEAAPGGQVVVYWFTHQADDSRQQAWFVGQASIPDLNLGAPTPPASGIELDLYQPIGTGFGADFNADDIELIPWGRIRFAFDGPDRGRVEWTSDVEGYESGEQPIERLTQPKLAECQ